MQAPGFVAGATLSASATVSAPAVIVKPQGPPEAAPSSAPELAGQDLRRIAAQLQASCECMCLIQLVRDGIVSD